MGAVPAQMRDHMTSLIQAWMHRGRLLNGDGFLGTSWSTSLVMTMLCSCSRRIAKLTKLRMTCSRQPSGRWGGRHKLP